MTTSKSASSLIPADPAKVMVIRDVTPNITTLSVPFLRFGHIKLGGRGTLVKLQTGNVAVFSPVALTPDVKAKVTSMGPIKYIVAPDIEHHIFISTWAKEYPEAEVIGMEGLPEKREGDPATKGTKFVHVFSAKNKLDMHITPEFDAEFSYEYFHSHTNKELVFLHKPSRTMIEADLLFNLPATEQYSKTGTHPNSGILTKLFAGIMNTKGEMTWQKRFLWYAAGGKDRKGFAESAKRIKSWDYDRVIPCHGDVIETGGKAIVDRATAWFTEGKH
ncbi:uncharacterized protein Z520_11372 [Fonsecaea multimorphosa CBS 102226]|uniref:Metallo-beta-lactamase domain-containing protein n=1 Tax=Fonsecaea multimorphosa CBS 102226 TaxID=1442371 RepID=A0A0D2I6Q3_9EURO|nr:uncharacterized protein Z520_11372 [Fonsecaea multimorphosa CBS 102226]KIX92896.1 hypothetical protein Z520_11372 [Fonsecaea multimorphosa CBS 102226]OAL18146.1 hypothetical protein AYO22_10923 [Fonsecaea multimorphosa]